MQKKLKAIILTADKFEDMELFFPYFRLLEEGVEVDIAAPQKGHIHGEHGYGLDMLYKFFFSKFYKKSIATANQDCPPP